MRDVQSSGQLHTIIGQLSLQWKRDETDGMLLLYTLSPWRYDN